MANQQSNGPRRRMSHPCPELLVRIACFDAYGSASDGVEWNTLRNRLGLKYRQFGYPNPVDGVSRIGHYVHTGRAIANARALLEPVKPGQEPTALNFANLYVDEARRSGVRDGYAPACRALLEDEGDRVRFGRDLLARLEPNACCSGAMVGAGVLGVLPDEQAVLRVATVQASVTHNTSCGIFSARVAALATNFALYSDVSMECLRPYLLERARYLSAPVQGEIDCGHRPLFVESLSRPWPSDQAIVAAEGYPLGLATIRASLTVATEERRLAGAMDRCLFMGGDVGATAAVAASVLAPRCRGDELDAFFERDLEWGSPDTGATRLRQLGFALMHAYA